MGWDPLRFLCFRAAGRGTPAPPGGNGGLGGLLPAHTALLRSTRMGVRGFAAAWGGCGGCRTTAHLLLPSARSRPSEGPGAAGRGGEEEESGLPPSWFCIRALLGLSVHLCVQPCRSTGIKAVCETVAVLGGSILPPPAAPPQPSPSPGSCVCSENWPRAAHGADVRPMAHTRPRGWHCRDVSFRSP